MKIEPWILSLIDPIFDEMQETIDTLISETENLKKEIESIHLSRFDKSKLEETMKNQEKIIQILTQKLDNLKLESVKAARKNATDKLTGLLTKPAIVPALTHHIEQNKRKSDNTYGCLLFIDVCGMNTLNYTYSHTGTDKIIQKFINSIIKHLRENDYAFRFGGDEVVIYLQNVSVAQAIKSVIRIITASQKQNPIKLSFYIGAEILIPRNNDVGTAIEKTLAQADRLVIAAKKARNAENGTDTYIAYKDNGKTVITTATQILTNT